MIIRPRSVRRHIFILLSVIHIAVPLEAAQLPSFNDLAANVDPHSGSVNLALPLETPSGRQGIQPNLQLQYSSNAANGMFGQGWSLELGSIQIAAKAGVPKYDGSDKYCLLQAGVSEDLVFDPLVGFYRTKHEGSFMKIEKLPDHWRITDKQGTKYYFGQDLASREYDPANTSKIYRWNLSRIEDVHGNYMLVSYVRDRQKLFPHRIDYTGHTTTASSPFARVEFELEDRADITITYMPGFKVEMAKRIKNIRMSVNNILQRRYELSYTESALTSRSMLERIIMRGSDDNSSLPALSFDYTEQLPADFVESGNLKIPSHLGITEGGGEDNGVRLADVNGDGLMDILWADGSGPSQYQTWINNGTGFTQSSQWLIPMIEGGGLSDFSMRLVDVNGDGRVDLVYSKGTNMSYHRTFINDGSRFAETSKWRMPSDMGFTEQSSGGDNGVRFADLNGDGLMDAIWADGTTTGQRKTLLNTGNDFVQTNNWIVPAALGFNESEWNDNGVRFADVNGDGLADLVWADGSDSSQYQTWLNNGSGFVQTSNWVVPMVQSGGLASPKLQLSDFNGDGLADVIWADGTNMAQHKTYINNGKNFVNNPNWIVPQSAGFNEEGSTSSNGVQLVDLNGDGMTDVVQADGADMSQHRTHLNSGVIPDLLARIDNGIGGVTTLTYDVSTRYENTLLPFVAAVVKTSTVSNTLGDSYTTTYHYADGLWLGGLTRDFRGYGLVKVIDVDGNYALKEFLQEDIYQGRLVEESSFDRDNRLFSKTKLTWDNVQIAAGTNFIFLKRKDNFIYDGDASGRRTAEISYFEETPQLGNLTKVVQLGEVDLATGEDVGTDSRTVETTYVNNSNTWILGLPSQIIVKDQAGTQVRKTWFYYDGQDNAAQPVEGLLSKKVEWSGFAESDPNNPKVEYNYDDYGNLISTKDPMGRITSITYDGQQHMFPMVTQNALAHRVVNKYFGVEGEPLIDGDGLSGLWGQLKSVTDPNGQTGRKSYDVFGRLVATISPSDSAVLPSSTVEYAQGPNFMKIKAGQRLRHGQERMAFSTTFIDGLGRELQTKTHSGASGQFIVQNQASYTSRGLLQKKFLPHFTSNGLDLLDAINANKPYSSIEYDAMGRVVRTLNPDGSYSTIEYDDWTLRHFNENGHKQESVFDAYGRLIEKREYVGADGRAQPLYPLAPFQLYASTRYVYDSEGNLIQTMDAHHNITTISYDKLGRKIAMDDPDMGQWSYNYDLAGNLIGQTDAKAQAINFDYDDLNRLKSKTGPGGLNVVYTYDDIAFPHSKGRLTNVEYGVNNKTSFSYDALGREDGSAKVIDGENFGVTRSYDAINRLIRIEYPDQKYIYYDYNEAGQIRSIADDPALIEEQSFIYSPVKDQWDVAKPSLVMIMINAFERYVLGIKPSYADEVKVVEEFAQGDGDFNFVKQFTGKMSTDVSPYINGSYIATGGYAGGALEIRLGGIDANDRREMLGGWEIRKELGQYLGQTTLMFRYRLLQSGSYESDEYSQAKVYFTKDNYSVIKTFDLAKFVGNGGNATPWNDTGWQYVSLNLGSQQSGTYNFIIAGFNNKKNSSNEETRILIDDVVIIQGLNNQAPTVNAGADSTIGVWQSKSLDATVIDDARPNPLIPLTYQWQKVSGPGNVIFGNSQSVDTTATFSTPGNYVLRLTTNDSVLSASDDIAIYVNPLSAPVAGVPTEGDARISLSWGAISAATGYKVKYGTASGNYSTSLDVGAATNYTVTGLNNNQTYYFVVSAYHAAVESSNSNEIAAMPQALASPPDIAEEAYIVKNVNYNASGQVVSMEYGNGDKITQEYDPFTLRLTRKYVMSGQGVVIQDLNYTYDPAGNIVRIDDHVNSATQDFRYDALGRLVQANGQRYGLKQYTYDEIGNIKTKDGKTYTYGAGAAGVHAVTSLSDGTTFTYDANGNMATRQKGNDLTEYFYDAENRLKEVRKNGAAQATFAYDGDGGRTKKIDSDGVTKYVGALHESRNGVESNSIYFGDIRVASLANGALKYFHSDHLGGANVMTDHLGVVKELIEYEPFGSLARHEMYGSGEDVARFYFTGKELDTDTGLYYYGARYYDAGLGRFITPDTLIPFPENPQVFNRFSYVHNNPANLVDPTGHFAWFVPAIIGAIKGSLMGATIGAGLAAITGSNIGQGAMLGAVSGATFGGAGGAMGHLAKQGINLSTGLQILTYAESGAYAGAAGAAILGSNPLKGAGYGALSGIIFGGLGKLGGRNTFWDSARVPLTGIAGGALSELSGGNFIDGFIVASAVAGSDFIYRAILRSQGADRGASLRTATRDAQPKLDKNGLLINNKPLHTDLDISQPGVPSMPDGSMEGFWEKFKNSIAGETGPAMNFIGKNIFGIQGLSLAHDITGHYLSNSVGGTINGIFFNFQTMPPVYGLNFVGSVINDNPSLIGLYAAYGREF